MNSGMRKITIRFSVEADADLLAWYDALRGRKGEALKKALRRQLSSAGEESVPQLDARNLLADIRQIVDVSIKSALEEYAPATEKRVPETEEDTEADDLLAALIDNSRIELEDDAPKPKNTGWGEHW